MSSYKHEHELFVAGHNGTTFTEIAALTSIPCSGCFLREILLLICIRSSGKSTIRNRLFLDFFTLVMPSVIAVTLLNNYIYEILALLVILSLLAYLFIFKRYNINVEYVLQKENLGEQKSFIVWYRSIVNLMTAIAILAVDFPVFPRRLAKSETYGFGGMDNGVGFFVISNAIVSPEARGKHFHRPIVSHLRHCFSGCIPLLVLGFGRLLAVKGTDYHEHVTEYGVHWNFFFTLAALKLTSTLLYSFISVDQSVMTGFALTGVHQVFLSSYGLSNYVKHGRDGTSSRVGLLDANREGILSIPGYLAIYVFGVALGQFLFEKRQHLRAWLVASKHLVFIILVCTAVMLGLHNHVEQVSRRLANATFVFWIVGNACLMLLACLLAEIVTTCVQLGMRHKQYSNTQNSADGTYEDVYQQFHKDLVGPGLRFREERDNAKSNKEPVNHEPEKKDVASFGKSEISVCLLDAVGYNALLFFLLANLMTGLVNLSMRTLHASPTTSIIVITGYLFVLSLVFVLLRLKNIRTKVW